VTIYRLKSIGHSVFKKVAIFASYAKKGQNCIFVKKSGVPKKFWAVNRLVDAFCARLSQAAA
jgi:hypothetical protein